MSRAAKQLKRQARRIPLPESETLTLHVEHVREPLILDRVENDPRFPTFFNERSVCYRGHGINVIVSASIHEEFGRLLHASVTLNDRVLPPWPIMHAVKDAIFPPDVAAILPLPEREHYTNVVEALHIIQCPGPWGNL